MKQHTIPTPYMVGDVHCYSAEIGGELVLFDTGPATAEAVAALERGLDISRIRYVFITHCHVDHYGLAARIAARSGARVFIPAKDAVKIERHEERLAHMTRILEECGFDREFCRSLRAMLDDYRVFPAIPERYEIVEEASVVGELGISWLGCPGHSQSDLVFICNGCAISGDTLLRNVFQAPLLDVDLSTFAGRFRNYDAYCRSLRALGSLSGLTILPGHRVGVDSLDRTILFYVTKLMERAALLKRVSGIPSVRETLRSIFGDSLSDPFLTYLKASEIVFMRDFLADPQQLKASLEEISLFDEVAGLYRSVTL